MARKKRTVVTGFAESDKKPEKKGKRNKKKVVDERWSKKSETGRVIKDKFIEEREIKTQTVHPKNPNQKLYLDSLRKNRITIAIGSSGSGKTYVACAYAANALVKGDIDRIVLIRPYEHTSRSIGLRPGSADEKLLPIMQSMLEPLEQVLGTANYQYHMEHGNIKMEALEDIRGRSYRNTMLIIDEASNCDVHTMKTLVTRLGNESSLVICGDSAAWQKDIKTKSGLTWFVDTIKTLRKSVPEYLDNEDANELYNNIGIITFTKDDVVRSGITKLFVKVFDEVLV